MSSSLLVTAIQFSSTAYKMTNLTKAEHLIKASLAEIKNSQYPHIVCLPEVFNFRSSEAEENNLNAEEIPLGYTFNWASSLAKNLNIWLIAGSILEADPQGGKPFNTSFVINPQGELIAKYRKINLFQLNLENTPELCEPRYRQAGNELCHFEIEGHKIGLAICFDLRFPEIFTHYAQENCELIFLPSAFTYKTGEAHWEILCKARAIENQCFFIAVNQSIEANCWGHSSIINPWGETLAVLDDSLEGFISAEIDLNEVEQIRKKLPLNRKTKIKTNAK